MERFVLLKDGIHTPDGFRRLRNGLIAGSLVLLLVVSMPGCSDSVSVPETPETGDPVWDQYAHGRARFYQRLHRFGVQRWPDLKPLFETQHEYHMADLRLRCLKFRYLLQHHPERIVRDRGLPEFVNFRWSDTDTRRLRETSKKFRQLHKRVKRLRGATFDHPDWPLARRRIRGLPEDSRYHQILDEFRRTRRRLSDRLSTSP